jgi:hypothetical protein
MMQNSPCDCTGNSGNSGNNGAFNMNMGNPQHQVNLNQPPLRISQQTNNNSMNNNSMNTVDLSSLGIPNNVANNNNNTALNTSKQDLINSLNKVSTDETMKGAVYDSYYILLKNINLAFVLVAAFAWNDAVKFYIAKLIRSHQGSPYYYLYYALIVTLLAIISVKLTRKFLVGN